MLLPPKTGLAASNIKDHNAHTVTQLSATMAIVSSKLHPHTLTLWGHLSNEAVPDEVNVSLPRSIIELQVETTKQAGNHNIELGEGETDDRTVSSQSEARYRRSLEGRRLMVDLL